MSAWAAAKPSRLSAIMVSTELTNFFTMSLPFAAPLFTCLGYANEGLPLNPRLAVFYQNKPDAFGFTPNPWA